MNEVSSVGPLIVLEMGEPHVGEKEEDKDGSNTCKARREIIVEMRE